MKWSTDPNGKLKFRILDVIIFGLDAQKAKMVTFQQVYDVIDKIFDELLKPKDKEIPLNSSNEE